ncbi:terminase small subunit [Achromobacter xylosoxidans]|uniref:terminase small subunit n=1 Tax=Alcaligenes xylosoxydans xylosoxydans TaxID=85698 RepID=UPI0006BFE270|nr:terminase small subunit [Achromobacter xylosoxidans]CUJ41484.1 Terminase small subunit [Achromobacter xylosoxidans]
MALTDKQRRFVDEYLVDLNATQAAIRAGYSAKTANEQGAQLLAKLSVREAVDAAQAKRAKRTEITQDEILNDLRELRDICMGRKPVTISEVVKNVQEGKAEAVDVCVSVLEPTAANRALELMGKHLGMFPSKVEHSGPGGGPMQSVSAVATTPDEAAKIYQQMMNP